MCIAILSTEHPSYSLILLSNRDEVLDRPTDRAHWWCAPHGHVLGGRDAQRDIKGTWLGVTRQGRLAVLTNFRAEGQAVVQAARSRGGMAKAFLTVAPESDEGPEEFAGRLIEEDAIRGVGGFSLLFGKLRKDATGRLARLAVISNGTADTSAITWLFGQGARQEGETHALSNSYFGDREWPKVVEGEQLMREAIAQSRARDETQEELIARGFQILSKDNLPHPKPNEEWESFVRHMRDSIFIPPVGQMAPQDGTTAARKDEPVINGPDMYGTKAQTVILVDQQGKVTMVERTLYDESATKVSEEERDRKCEFVIEGWGNSDNAR